MTHVHPHVTTVHAGPRARAVFQEILLYLVPLLVGKIEGFRAPLEPALHLRAAPADDMKLTTVEYCAPLPCQAVEPTHPLPRHTPALTSMRSSNQHTPPAPNLAYLLILLS